MESVEILGLSASLFILASFVLSGEKKIRSVNIIGALLFVIYGIITNALSVWLLNGILTLLHIYKLIRIKK